MRSVHALLLALFTACAAIAGTAWWIARESSHETAPAVEFQGKPRLASSEELPAADTHAAQRDAQQAEAQPRSAPRPLPAGTLRLRVLDAATHAPVAQLRFVVCRERGAEFVLAHGTTDKDGRAEILGLEQDALFVRTERKPPYAEQCAGFALDAEHARELLIEVGAGGVLTGRVVDDRKRPLAGASIFLEELASVWDPREPLVHTGADGRFRIECVASRAGELALEEGAWRVDSWKPVPLTALHEHMRVCVQAEPKPGEEVDLGDLELSRTATYLGLVVDAEKRPLPGALLSVRPERMGARLETSEASGAAALLLGPADAGFELLEGEVLTDSAGRFELHTDGHEPKLLVRTRAGEEQPFQLPALEPGARKEEILIEVAPRLELELQLVLHDGASAPVPALGISAQGLRAPWGLGGKYGTGRVWALARSGGATIAWDSTAVHGADGRWRLQLRAPPARIEELEISASGYEPLVEHPDQGFLAHTRLRRELEELPALHVRLEAPRELEQLLPAPGAPLELHACMADPLRSAGTELGSCCGFGVFWQGEWRGEALSLVLPVRRKAAFWIYARVRGSEGGLGGLASFGPFDPGAEEHAIEFDPRPPAALAGRDARVRVSPSARGDVPRVEARFEDAHTGKALALAALQLSEVVAAPRIARTQSIASDETGRIQDAAVRPGRWAIRATLRGYEPAEVGERDFPRGETLDLGRIALVPLPEHTGRLLDAEGKPLPNAWLMLADGVTVDVDGSRMALCSAGGDFSFFGELPPKFVLHVRCAPAARGEPSDSQRFALEPWPATEKKIVRLRPARRVLLTLIGVSPEDAVLPISVCPSPEEETALCDHRLPIHAFHVPLENAVPFEALPGAQRCALRLAAGRYQAYGQNVLHSLPATSFEVTQGDGDLELTLVAH
ncbi:MAG: carboxypeptidase regulatory-like domain-containing protein [Planctomycetes bacterium]|nr:carboxypeptidase regulatory-like domain-containing protein [Planctomycetota bacterium]